MTFQLSIVHRLPQDYRWSAGFAGSKVEPIPQNGVAGDNALVALKLLSPDGDNAWPVMHSLSQALTDISVDCSVKGSRACSSNVRTSLPLPAA